MEGRWDSLLCVVSCSVAAVFMLIGQAAGRKVRLLQGAKQVESLAGATAQLFRPATPGLPTTRNSKHTLSALFLNNSERNGYAVLSVSLGPDQVQGALT
jgi:hypothetical protein